MIYLTTVMHTGTRTVLKMFKKNLLSWNGKHCSRDMLDELSDERIHKIMTTYRDPYRVAASWINRGKSLDGNWYDQWQTWVDIIDQYNVDFIDLNTLEISFSHPDKYYLHRHLDNKNFEAYFERVPQEAIEFALNLSEICNNGK